MLAGSDAKRAIRTIACVVGSKTRSESDMVELRICCLNQG